MAEVKSSKPRRTGPRTGHLSLNPYVLDEIAPTLAEIRRARGGLQANGPEAAISPLTDPVDVNQQPIQGLNIQAA